MLPSPSILVFDGLTRRDKIMRLRPIERQLLPIGVVRCEEITGETEGTVP